MTPAHRRSFSFHSMQSRVRVALIAWALLLIIIGAYGLIPATVESSNLRDVRSSQDQIYNPAAELVTALQQERHLSVQVIDGDGSGQPALQDQREETDRAISSFQQLSDSSASRKNDTLAKRIDAALSQLSDVEAQRAAIDAGSVSRIDAADAYTAMIDSTFPVFYASPVGNEPFVSKSHQMLVAIQRFREVLARESTLLAGAITDGQLTEAGRQELDQLVAIRRFQIGEIQSALTGSQERAFDRIVQGQWFTQLRGQEDNLLNQDSEGSIPVSSGDWSSAGAEAFSELADLESDFASRMLENSDSEATAILVKAVLVTLAVLVVGLALTIMWFRVAPRHVLRELTTLQKTALDFAHNRLPSVVVKLQRGERVDVQSEVPPLESGKDEFGDVSRAFNSVRQVAVQAAVDQADLRNGIRDVFVNLARRSQGLVHRQLLLLDKMERDTNDPDELERLFAIDHLATRLRRHAEDLIILSGSAPGRQWRKPVPMINVIRSAVGETEAYNRVNVSQIDDARLAGRLVADVIPLLSALVDNATAYSPPQTKVRVVGTLVPSGFVVEIEDSGLGMTDGELALFNQKLARPPEFNLSDTVQLGLFVVAHLAHRHNINVTLRRSPYGGTTAIVLIPGALLDSQHTFLEGSSVTTTGPASPGAEPVEEPNESIPEDASGFAEPVAPPSDLTDDDAADEAPEAGSPEQESAVEDSDETGILPKRERQASLIEELRGMAPAPREEQDGYSDTSAERTPEQIRTMMTTFQRGSLQGNKVAEELDLSDTAEPQNTPAAFNDTQR